MKNNNALFYTCSLIEYIGRTTKQRRSAVVKYLGAIPEKEYINMQMYFTVTPLKRLQTSLSTLSISRQTHLIM